MPRKAGRSITGRTLCKGTFRSVRKGRYRNYWNLRREKRWNNSAERDGGRWKLWRRKRRNISRNEGARSSRAPGRLGRNQRRTAIISPSIEKGCRFGRKKKTRVRAGKIARVKERNGGIRDEFVCWCLCVSLV